MWFYKYTEQRRVLKDSLNKGLLSIKDACFDPVLYNIPSCTMTSLYRRFFMVSAFLYTEVLLYTLCIGLSDVPAESMVKVYCPKCVDVYTPKSSRHHHIDGVYFGTGFPHMLFMVHPELRPPKPSNQFVPRYIIYVCFNVSAGVCHALCSDVAT